MISRSHLAMQSVIGVTAENGVPCGTGSGVAEGILSPRCSAPIGAFEAWTLRSLASAMKFEYGGWNNVEPVRKQDDKLTTLSEKLRVNHQGQLAKYKLWQQRLNTVRP